MGGSFRQGWPGQLRPISALRALIDILMEKETGDNAKMENEINCSLGLLNVNCI